MKAVRALPAATGVYKVPTLMITTQYDNIVPAGNQQWYFDRLKASAKAQKAALPKIAQFYTEPPLDGWEVFDPGAKGPNAAASYAAATSGVGHCNFLPGNSLRDDQLLSSVAGLSALVNARNATQVAASTAWCAGRRA